MLTQFIQDNGNNELTLEECEDACPWASEFRRACGGVWCFESSADADIWDAQV